MRYHAFATTGVVLVSQVAAARRDDDHPVVPLHLINLTAPMSLHHLSLFISPLPPPLPLPSRPALLAT